MKTHHGIIPHRETNGIAQRAVRRIEGGSSAVLLQSGLDEKMVEVVGRLVKSDLENHLKDQ